MLINKTVDIDLEKNIIKSKSIIVDSIHTKARYNQKFPREILLEYSKRLRNPSMRWYNESKFPSKINNGILQD